MERNYRRHVKKGLQGPRPTPLKIDKNSRGICKSSTIRPVFQCRKPVVIYIRSPKVIHTQPQDFMALVQRLTGSSPTRFRYQESIIQNEAAVEVLRPSTRTDHSQFATNSSSDENINNMSALVQDKDQMQMSGTTVNAFAKLEEELMEDSPPNIMASFCAEDGHVCLLHSSDIVPPSSNNMALMKRSHAVQDYQVNTYERSQLLDSFIHSDSSAPRLGMPDVSDPLHSLTSLPHDCLFLDRFDFYIPSPATLDLFNNVQKHQS